MVLFQNWHRKHIKGEEKRGQNGSKESGRIVKKERFAVFQYNWGKFVFLIPRADKAIAGTRIND